MWLDIVNTIIEVISKKVSIDEKKRLKLSQLFFDVAKLLEDTAKDLEQDVYPHGKCAAMESLSRELVSILKNSMDEEPLQELSHQLFVASNLELEYAMRKSKDTIVTLQKTAGRFEALGMLYKAV
jgi:hypothetical protein